MQQYIYIFKGDDTNWNGEQFLTVNITSQTADLSNMTAKFILGSYEKTYPLTTGSFDIDLNAATTGSYAYGPICGTIQVIDEEERIKTVANRIPFYITDQVIAEQVQTLDIAMPEGSEISISLEVGKAAQITVDEELSTTSPNPVQNRVITLALEGKQNNLTAAQLNAANSGVTSAKVAQIDTNASNITALQTASANNYTKTNLTAGTNMSITPSQADPNVFEVNNTQDISGLTTDVTDLKANALKNTATGTNALTILGTPATVSNALNVGQRSVARNISAIAIGNANAGGQSSVAMGAYAFAIGLKSIAIGGQSMGARANASETIQLGEGTNTTAKTLQVYSYQLLDGNTGKIPAERLPDVFANIQKAANFNVVGPISIDYNWVASNFSNTRYLIGPNNPTGAITSAQFDLKIKTPSSLSGDNFRCMLGQSAHNFYTPQIDFIGNEFHFRVSTDGTSWKDVAVSGQFSTNTDYYIRGVFDGTKLQAFKSANGVDYTQIGSDVPCSSMYWAEQMLIGLDTDAGGDLTGAWTGSIYLEDLSIKINGQDYWKAVNFMNSNLTLYPGYDATKTQVLKNINGVLTWVEEA